ncbi:MAG: retropepsin-like aspartic protease [Desulfobacterales bacterium]
MVQLSVNPNSPDQQKIARSTTDGYASVDEPSMPQPSTFVSTVYMSLSKPIVEIENLVNASDANSATSPKTYISTAYIELKNKPEVSPANISQKNNQDNVIPYPEKPSFVPSKHGKKIKRKKKLRKQLKKLKNKTSLNCNNVEIIEVRRVHFSKSSSIVPIQISNTSINAVIDSGAQVTILSDKVYQNLVKKPPIVGPVKLRMADGNTLTDGLRVGPVKMKIGEKFYHYYIIVAPLAEEMLFGHDILKSQPECTMDFIRGALYFDGQIILTGSENSDDPDNSDITTTQRIKIPAGSIRRVACKMNKNLDDFIIETFSHLKIIAPKVLRKGGTDPIVCLLNPRDRPVIIKKMEHVPGHAKECSMLSAISCQPLFCRGTNCCVCLPSE